MNSFFKGFVLAAASIFVAFLVPHDIVAPLFALLLAFAAAVYVGFAEVDEEDGERRVQWAIALSFVVIALLGLWISNWLLVVGWVLHAGWDFLHHRKVLHTRTSQWYPGACLVYDLIVAGYLAVWMWPTG